MPFDNKRIKELSKLMDKLGLKRLAFKDKEGEIELEKAGIMPEITHGHPPHLAPAAPNPAHPPAPNESVKKAEGKAIKSPLVGTFYAASAPGEPPFVKVGDLVTPDTVVGIVEAMKVMNEVKAAVSGRITECLVEDGQPVEFESPLFRVE
jgi:acetyl-CoA carboxylase biotin carboxyl carrier protein